MHTIEEFKKEIMKLRIEKPAEALADLAALTKIAEENGDRELLGYCHYYNADCYLTLADTENCIRESHAALTFYDIKPATPTSVSEMGLCYNLLSIAYIQQADIAHALQSLGEVIKLASKHNNSYLGMLAHINYSELCLLGGLNEEGYTHALQAEVCYFEDGAKEIARPLRTMNLADLVNVSMRLRRYDIARANIDKLRELIAAYPDMAELPNYMLAELFRSDEASSNNEARLNRAPATTPDGREITAVSVVDAFLTYPSLAEVGAETEMLIQHLLNAKHYDLLEKLLDKYADEVKDTPFLGPRLTVAKYQVLLYRAINNSEKLSVALANYYDCTEAKALFEGHNAMSLLSTSSELHHSVEQNEILRKKAETDELTGVSNRRRLNELLDLCFAEAVAKELPLMVEMLDIDNFKSINDNNGHIIGDRVLIKVGQALKTVCDDPRYRGKLFAGRYGGDEFTLISIGLADTDMQEIAETIQSLIADNEEDNSEASLPTFTLSQGVYGHVPHGPNKIWDFTSGADKVLYHVKQTGKNNILVVTHPGDLEFEELILTK